MERVATYNFSENFIDKVVDYLLDNFLDKNSDLSRVACIFGGKRPGLFLKRGISQRLNKSYIPPKVFSADEFIDYLISEDGYPRKINDLDSYFLIYNFAKEHIPNFLKGINSFSEFLPWAREIASFIDQLDLEDIKNKSLQRVESSAAIGYEIPASINRLLEHIVSLRDKYHKFLDKNNMYSRGTKYLKAASCVGSNNFEEFDTIIFCNFFYLHSTEQKIIKNIYEKGKGICLFQSSDDKWTVLENNAKEIGISIALKEKPVALNLNFYQGFDLHSQVCVIREIMKEKIKDKNDTVIVVPRPEAVIPLLSEIGVVLNEFNVSMGYPFRRSSLYVLFDSLLRAQESNKGNKYYTRDYLNCLQHPLIKNLRISEDPAVTRVLIHKIEELLQGTEKTSISGSLFLSLDEIEAENIIYQRVCRTLENMQIDISLDKCKSILKSVHDIFFRPWEKINDFNCFAQRLENLLETLTEKSKLGDFPFNLKAIDKLHLIKEEFKSLMLSNEKFTSSEIREIFRQKIEREKISFMGSPLNGTQILGLFETRSLNFKNVIVLDLNESVLPKLKLHEPLIPREVMLSLGLNRLEKEEEIQRYQFMRLIAGAKQVHLVYEENQEKEKSRFIEELLWRKQSKDRQLKAIAIPKANFSINVGYKPLCKNKTPSMVKFLKQATYSASRINTYLRCPLQFYYQYILGFKEKQDLLSDPQASCIGTFIHELLEETFREFINKKPLIDGRFRKYFFSRLDDKFNKELSQRMHSDSFLLKRIIENRLKKFLDSETERNVKRIICLEEDRRGTIALDNEIIEFRYTVDRIDELEDKSIVIIDYKTGGANIIPKKLSSLEKMDMNRKSIKDNIRSFQLPIYYYLIAQDFANNTSLNAQLYNIRTCERKYFIGDDDLICKDQLMAKCLQALGVILQEIFDPGTVFIADKDQRSCQFCSFVSLCR